jgi:2'-5' RNA ligase
MMKRLFLGIALTQAQQSQLSSLQENLLSDAKKVRPANFHMTLAFLGQLDIHHQYKLQHMLDIRHRCLALSWPKFTVTLDTLTLWRKPQVLCLSGKNWDPHLQLIIDDCRAIMQQIGIDIAIRKNTEMQEDCVQQALPIVFIPHVSLFRKAKYLPECPPISLTLAPDKVHLYASVSGPSGVEYQILQSWPLIEK